MGLKTVHPFLKKSNLKNQGKKMAIRPYLENFDAKNQYYKVTVNIGLNNIQNKEDLIIALRKHIDELEKAPVESLDNDFLVFNNESCIISKSEMSFFNDGMFFDVGIGKNGKIGSGQLPFNKYKEDGSFVNHYEIKEDGTITRFFCKEVDETTMEIAGFSVTDKDGKVIKESTKGYK